MYHMVNFVPYGNIACSVFSNFPNGNYDIAQSHFMDELFYWLYYKFDLYINYIKNYQPCNFSILLIFIHI